MTKLLLKLCLIITYLFIASLKPSYAAPEGFSTGPVFENYGENTLIEGGLSQPELQRFRVVFDVYKENDSSNPHQGFNSVARFINMHVRGGVPRENIDVALVIHGKASYDLMTRRAFNKKFEKENPSSDLLDELLKNKVKVFVCGQSSSFLGLEQSDLNEGVEMSLSAMTANALLQQQEYTLNPF